MTAVSRRLRTTLLPVLLLLAWQIWAQNLPPRTRAPSPLHVAQAFADMLASGELTGAIIGSLGRVASGFLIAAAIGIALGVLMGARPAIRRNLDPIIEAFRPVAAIAILPLAILWFGTGTPAAVFIVAYAAFFPMVVNTVHGVSRVDRRVVQAAMTMGVPPLTILRRVVLPGALPGIFVGTRLSMGVAWTAIIAAELAVGSKAGADETGGIGQMMFVFYAFSVDLNGIVVCMIVVGVVSLIIDRGMRALERWAMPWRT